MLLVDVRHRLGDFRLNIMMEAPSSGITVIVGSSGAGKSSLLAIIAGHLRPHQGMIRLGDALLLDTDAGRFVPPERRRIGIVHQDSRLFPHMPVSANLLYGLKRTNRPIRIKPEEVVEILSIGHLLDRQPRNLSGGERQRVALGRAMLSQPDLLLMDEPVSALDPRLRSDVLSLTQSLNQRFGLPILYVTHNVEEARRLADHVVRLDHGKVIAHGRPQDLLPSAWLTGEVIRHENGRTLVLLGGSEYWLPEIDAPPGSMVTLTAEHPSESTA